MKGFLHTHERAVEEVDDPQNPGQRATLVRSTPREIKELTDEAWDDSEYVNSMLKVVLSKPRQTQNGNVRRTIFARGSSGPDDGKGGTYRQLRLGQLIQGRTKPDPETGDSSLWTMVILEGNRENQQASQQAGDAQDTPSEADAAQEATEKVESL